MALVSLYGGLALANSGLGVVHGFAAPIGGMFDAPHGAVCAALLPHGVRANIAALRDRAPGHPALARYYELASDPVEWLTGLCRQLNIQPLSAYGITSRDIPDLVDKAAKASSMKANPIPLTTPELTALLEAAM
jgi:alcohol dehydrogenase class IV